MEKILWNPGALDLFCELLISKEFVQELLPAQIYSVLHAITKVSFTPPDKKVRFVSNTTNLQTLAKTLYRYCPK